MMGKKIRSDARQLHMRGSKEEKKEALELFNKLKSKGYEKVRLSEFEKGVEPADLSTEKVFNELDLDADGCLDFDDFLVLFYYMKNKITILRCDGCHVLLFGARFLCSKCIFSRFSSDQDRHPLCRACHAGGKFGHEHHFKQRVPQGIPKKDDKVEGKNTEQPWKIWGWKDKQANVQLPPQGVGRKYKQANVQLPPQVVGRMYKQANVQPPPQGLGRKDKQANVQLQFQQAPLRGAEFMNNNFEDQLQQVRKDNGKQWNFAKLWGWRGPQKDMNAKRYPYPGPGLKGGNGIDPGKLKKDAVPNKVKIKVSSAAATSSSSFSSSSTLPSHASSSRSSSITNSKAGSSSTSYSHNGTNSKASTTSSSRPESSSHHLVESPYAALSQPPSRGKKPKGGS